jgi:hypothetical protein
MSKITQYRPAFVTGFENDVREFNSLKELFGIEWVENFSLSGGIKDTSFYRYSYDHYSDYKDKEYTLMAEYNDGYEWWVIGFVNDNQIIKELPIWKPKYGQNNK